MREKEGITPAAPGAYGRDVDKEPVIWLRSQLRSGMFEVRLPEKINLVDVEAFEGYMRLLRHVMTVRAPKIIGPAPAGLPAPESSSVKGSDPSPTPSHQAHP